MDSVIDLYSYLQSFVSTLRDKREFERLESEAKGDVQIKYLQKRCNKKKNLQIDTQMCIRDSPCAGHSLQLVGSAAVNSNDYSVAFFSLEQQLYNFFSSSTSRWEILLSHLKKTLLC